MQKTLKELRKEHYVYHIFTPALVYNFENKCSLPIMAIRFSSNKYNTMLLADELNIDGPSDLKIVPALPGTGGRGIAICHTQSPIKMIFRKKSPIFDCDGDPKDILKRVLKFFL